jgi:hypothetical protein
MPQSKTAFLTLKISLENSQTAPKKSQRPWTKLSIANKPVLLLNADRSIIATRPLHRILSLYFSGRIQVLKTVGTTILHPSLDICGIPIVVSFKDYVVIPFRKVTITKKRVFQRDSFTCQYCGKPLTDLEATIDHVVPKSHANFPGNTWENLVTSCKKCNNRKGGRTPEEANFTLLRKPFKPLRGFIDVGFSKDWEEFL